MTKEQFFKRVDELIEENDKAIREKAEKILKSGCVDLASYEDDFRLPKCFMCAFGRFMESGLGWKPHSKELLEEIENIYLFI